MSEDKKPKEYRVKLPWIGGPEAGEIISEPIHPAIRANVEPVLGKQSSAETKATKILDQAREEATSILVQARSEAEGIAGAAKADRAEAAKVLDQARIDSDKMIEDARSEAARIVDEAKPAGNGRR